jgi:hypothetical protein
MGSQKMTSRRRIRRAAVAVVAGVAAGTAVFAGTASAMPTDRGQCNVSDVDARVTDNGLGAGTHTYILILAATPGMSCQVGGSPHLAQFLSANGHVASVNINSANPASWPQVTIDAAHSAEIDIKTANQSGMPVTSLRFEIPSGGENTIATTPWTPGSIAGRAEFSIVRSVPAIR